MRYGSDFYKLILPKLAELPSTFAGSPSKLQCAANLLHNPDEQRHPTMDNNDTEISIKDS
jgi:hypothetical protein